MQTEKRIHVSLTEKSVKQLSELEQKLDESQSSVIRQSISHYHHHILTDKEDDQC